MKKMIKTVFYLFFPLMVGGLVSLLIMNKIDYSWLDKPPLAPPKIAFPIVWTIIYLLMGISYFLLKKEEENVSSLYYLQLFVNALWSIIFFAFQWRFVAILWIILLDGLVGLMIVEFYEKKWISVYLNIPYFL